jgi:transposase InsO family protein
LLHLGKPLECLTDHGSQFYANSGEIKAAAISTFQQYLVGKKINHILGRVYHPQTNGKIERFYETFQEAITLYYMQVTYGKHMTNRNMRRSVNYFRKLYELSER